MELVSTKFCHAVSTGVPSTLVCQLLSKVLSDLAPATGAAPALFRVLIPYACLPLTDGPTAVPSASLSLQKKGIVAVRSLSLTVLCNAVRFMESNQLLQLLRLPSSSNSATPPVSLLQGCILNLNTSTEADLRKGAVFLLVELYLALGDSMHPFVSHQLTSAQKKLLTIYVDKRIAQRNLKDKK